MLCYIFTREGSLHFVAFSSIINVHFDTKASMSSSQPVKNNEQILASQYSTIRNFSESLCKPLEIEDFCLQSMPDASPVKWHLAHTSWFFETFLLEPFVKGYKPFNKNFNYLFNSYYNAVGKQYPRPQRGLQSRPTVAEVFQYRKYVDEQIVELISNHHPQKSVIEYRLELGLNHEQQHQELMLTDLKHAWSYNPMTPAYQPKSNPSVSSVNGTLALNWSEYKSGLYPMGSTDNQFCFDNELPKHDVHLVDFQIAKRLVSNGEYLEFVESAGYQDAMQWLSEGWGIIQQQQWKHPIYWHQIDGKWFEYTLQGLLPLDLSLPACHLSYFEADAYARWCGARLATEFEWELAAKEQILSGNFVESKEFHPTAATASNQQFFGDCWEWTSSSYSAYPGFSTAAGAIGEYNGKFMCNQMVLRGGSCVTSSSHIRPTYRNFFYTDARWQFSGIRLAKDL